MNKPGVKSRAFLLAFIPMLFITGLLSIYFVNDQLKTIESNLISNGNSLTRHISQASEFGVFSENYDVLNDLLNSLINERDVVSITITDNTGKVLAQALSNNTISTETNYYNSSNYRIFRRPILLFKTPVNDLSIEYNNTIKNNQDILGWVETKLTTSELEQQKINTILNSIFIILLGMIISMLLATWIARGLTVPISRLTSSVRNIGQGNLNISIDNNSPGEIGELEKGVKSMLGKVKLSHNELQEKIDKSTSVLKNSLNLLENQNQELADARKKAMQANLAKSKFIANMSHEIRTPMNGIIGFIRLLKESGITDKQSEYLDTIDKSANNLLILINDILDISKIESGNLNIKDTLFSLDECIEDIILLMEPAAQEKKLVITKKISANVPGSIYAPRERVCQVLINFISNAIKFSDKGTIIVKATLVNDDSESSKIKLSVIDEGIGISEDDMALLFSPFSQINAEDSSNQVGTGLGLAISKSLSETMGGNVGVEPTSDGGSSFWFTFRYNPYLSKDTTKIVEQAESKGSVLLYDINDLTRESISSDLESAGLEVTDCTDIDSLLTILKHNNKYNYCALSLSHDEMDISYIEKLITNITNISKAKLFLLTSFFDPIKSTHLYNIGADFCIQKPYRKKNLLRLLNRLLNNNHKNDNEEIGKINSDYLGIEQKNDLKGRHILIAEDNKINATLLKTVLKQNDAITFYAKNGHEAVEIFNTNYIDLILMDLHMPGLNGIDATNIIRKSEGNKAHTPIIGLTASAMKDHKSTIKSSGFDETLIKPIAIDDLLDEIKYWIHYQHKQKNNELKINGSRSVLRHKANISNESTYGRLGIDEKLASSLQNMLLEELPHIKIQLNTLFKSKDWAALIEQVYNLLGGIAYCDVPELRKATLIFHSSLKKESSSIESDFNFLQSEINSLLH